MRERAELIKHGITIERPYWVTNAVENIGPPSEVPVGALEEQVQINYPAIYEAI